CPVMPACVALDDGSAWLRGLLWRRPTLLLLVLPSRELVVGDERALLQVTGIVGPGDLEPMSAGIEEIDRLAEAVIGRSKNLDPFGFNPLLDLRKLVHAVNFEREVLNPLRCILVAPLWRGERHVDEIEEAAVLHLHEQVAVGAELAG